MHRIIKFNNFYNTCKKPCCEYVFTIYYNSTPVYVQEALNKRVILDLGYRLITIIDENILLKYNIVLKSKFQSIVYSI